MDGMPISRGRSTVCEGAHAVVEELKRAFEGWARPTLVDVTYESHLAILWLKRSVLFSSGGRLSGCLLAAFLRTANTTCKMLLAGLCLGVGTG